ncbi:hypothetical protein MHL39_10875 [Roseomonas mucosa]|uniref:hypothetical protein n=1 Tax=Roseomonas mucosa TaxID=207340 RepID=UPI001EF679A4|nr:hypothetical protein [Roseomonas mucosa]MCG7357142.1 hypothetical protein [Roseomonas mucosa]
MLATVEALRRKLGAAAQGRDDAELEALLEEASAAAESYTGRTFAFGLETRRVRRVEGGTILLRRLPVLAVVSVELGAFAFETPTPPDPPIWNLLPVSGILTITGCPVAWDGMPASVTYSGGYILPGEEPVEGVPPLPADVSAAVVAIAAGQVVPSMAAQGIRSETVEGVGSTTYRDADTADQGLPADAARALRRYRLIG